ncbi:hypothetical protein [Paenibacillus sanguinis]|uniref:hypothetical protein n=1 Tax=Paenibacillus sanguinis TaxID=225906 RepID=UPI0003739AEA|nr:hypothetical protein [Paenibacillus sanguinis]
MFEKFSDYMFYLLFGPLKKVIKKGNQFYIFFKVIGKLFDRSKQDIFRVREESMLISASELLLDEHGRERDMPRLKGEDLESYRMRLMMKNVIAEQAGTKNGILVALKALGYDQSYIEPYYLYDPARWAEFIVYLGSKTPPGVNSLSVINAEVMKLKPARSKPNYGIRFDFHHQYKIKTRLRLRSRVNFFGGYPWYLDGVEQLNGHPSLSGWAGNRPRFNNQILLRSKQLNEIRQDAIIRQRHNYWLLDGSVPLDGSRLLSATETIITI